jgi:hypothetical protein
MATAHSDVYVARTVDLTGERESETYARLARVKGASESQSQMTSTSQPGD